MPTVWRAADVAPSERQDSFLHFGTKSLVPYEYPSRGVQVLADQDEVRAADIGMLRFLRFGWTQGEATRSARQVRRSDPELCKIDVQLSGRTLFEQFDRQAALRSGTFTFVDLSRPHRITARRVGLTAVMFPRSLLPLRDKEIKELAGATFDVAHPGSALVTSVVREMAANLDAYEGPGGARIAASVLDLISATLAARVDRSHAVPYEARRRVLLMRIRSFIEDNLGDPDLTPPVVAAAHHISLRTLHGLFEDEGATVARAIRERRLARCRHDLLDPFQMSKPVSAIAARWGFRDAAHFSRLFRTEYGMPPSEYRRLAAGLCP